MDPYAELVLTFSKGQCFFCGEGSAPFVETDAWGYDTFAHGDCIREATLADIEHLDEAPGAPGYNAHNWR